MQYACTILSSVTCLALQHFSALFHEWHYFWKKLWNIKHVINFSPNLSETILIPRWIQWDRSKMYIGLHVKYPLFWSDFNEPWSAGQIFEKYSNVKFTKFCPAEAELLHEDRQTRRNFITCHNFVNAPKKNGDGKNNTCIINGF